MRYPLVFNVGSLVAGKGFVASFRLQGRALVEEEEGGEIWFYGVNPGGVAADGPTRGEAFQAFTVACNSVILDLAEVSDSFEEFKAGVERFFRETNEPTEKEWLDGVRQVRQGMTVEGLARSEGSLEREPKVTVELVADPTSDQAPLPSPEANQEPNKELLAA